MKTSWRAAALTAVAAVAVASRTTDDNDEYIFEESNDRVTPNEHDQHDEHDAHHYHHHHHYGHMGHMGHHQMGGYGYGWREENGNDSVERSPEALKPNEPEQAAQRSSDVRALNKKKGVPTVWEPMTYTDPLPPSEDQLRRSTPIWLPPTTRQMSTYGAAHSADECLYRVGGEPTGVPYRLMSETRGGAGEAVLEFRSATPEIRVLSEKECLNALGVSSWTSARRLLERRAREFAVRAPAASNPQGKQKPQDVSSEEVQTEAQYDLPELFMCVREKEFYEQQSIAASAEARQMNKKKGVPTHWEPMTYTDPLPPSEDQLRRSTNINLKPTVLCLKDFARIARSGYAVPPGTTAIRRLATAGGPLVKTSYGETAEDVAFAEAALKALNATQVSIDGLVRKLHCQGGADLVDGQCVTQEVYPAVLICPPQSVPVDGKCRAESQPFVDCGTGFDLVNGEHCVRKEMRPADVRCPSPDMHFDADTLSCVEKVPADRTCPAGFSLDEGRDKRGSCAREVPPEYFCEESDPAYVLNPEVERQCFKSVTVPATLVCPAGASLTADKKFCAALQQDPPRCPLGFSYNAALDTCVRPSGAVETRCPAGFTRSPTNASCERRLEHPPTLKCPNDYTLDARERDPETQSARCVGEVAVPPRCKDGLRPSELYEGACERVVPENHFCPEGTRAVGAGAGLQCQVTRKHAPVLSCSPGFSLDADGRCRRVEETAPSASPACDGDGDSRMREKVYPLRFACPSGTEFFEEPGVGPRCVRGITADACIQARTPDQVWLSACLQQEARRNKKASAPGAEAPSLRNENTRVDGAKAVEQCQQQRAALPKCEDSGPARNLFNAQPFCAEGGRVESRRSATSGELEKVCVSSEKVAAQQVCSVGRLENGRCVREVVVPAKEECPPGTLRTSASECVSSEHREPRLACPAGSYGGPDGFCFAYEAMEYFPPQKVYASPDLICANPDATLKDGVCVENEVQPVEIRCAPNTVAVDNECMETAFLIVPKTVDKLLPPSFVCPKNYEPANGPDSLKLCRTTLTKPANIKCPLGSVQRDDKCFRQVSPFEPAPRTVHHRAVVTCPEESLPRGSNCLVTLRERPRRTCPIQMIYQNGKCVRILDKRVVCPGGTEVTENQCIRTVKVPASVEVLEGCVTEIVKPCPDCPKSVKTVCRSPKPILS